MGFRQLFVSPDSTGRCWIWCWIRLASSRIMTFPLWRRSRLFWCDDQHTWTNQSRIESRKAGCGIGTRWHFHYFCNCAGMLLSADRSVTWKQVFAPTISIVPTLKNSTAKQYRSLQNTILLLRNCPRTICCAKAKKQAPSTSREYGDRRASDHSAFWLFTPWFGVGLG